MYVLIKSFDSLVKRLKLMLYKYICVFFLNPQIILTLK